MTAYSFHPRFVEPIRTGTKGGTIRAPHRGRPMREGGHSFAGDELQLYCRQRTKGGFLIRRVTCVAVRPIWLSFHRVSPFVEIAGERMHDLQSLNRLAFFDGFVNFDAMAEFWGPAEAFRGYHIRWRELLL